MFDSREVRTLREENVALRAQLSDREGFIRTLLEEHAKERRDLLDRVLALAQPTALRAVRDEGGILPAAFAGAHTQARPPVPNLPGREPNLRPIPRPRAVSSPFSDIEAAADLEKER